MQNRVKLTDWESGLPIYVDRSAIKSVRRLPAEHPDPLLDGDEPRELGERTRVDTATDMFLVRESAEEVLGIDEDQPKGIANGPVTEARIDCLPSRKENNGTQGREPLHP